MTVSSPHPRTTRVRFITGMVCTRPGLYIFDRYADHSDQPSPASDEINITLRQGNVFPPVRSAGKSAWWKWDREI
ncbi:YjzC family protein [bacterium]|nr:MAG: YjzC family protein [bacterium]